MGPGSLQFCLSLAERTLLTTDLVAVWLWGSLDVHQLQMAGFPKFVCARNGACSGAVSEGPVPLPHAHSPTVQVAKHQSIGS